MVLLKYLEIGDIVGKIMLLNRKMRDLVHSENYLVFKHFLRTFNLLNERLKRTDIPARTDIIQLLKENHAICK